MPGLRRLLRSLINASPILSLLLFVLTAFLLIRSYSTIDLVKREYLGSACTAWSGRGQLYLRWVDTRGASFEPGWWFESWPAGNSVLRDQTATFAGGRATGGLIARNQSIFKDLTARDTQAKIEEIYARVGLAQMGGSSKHLVKWKLAKQEAARQENLLNREQRDLLRPQYVLMVPHWAIGLVSLILPVRWLRRARRRAVSRRTPGGCVNCGYDLRASPERCPECGESSRVGLGV